MNINSNILDTEEKTREWLKLHYPKTFTNIHPEFIILYNLLKRHPNYSNWKNNIPAAFKITKGKGNKAIQLMVKFSSNKFRIVSWVACANMKLKRKYTYGDANSEYNQLISAMRYAIRRQISNYRKRNINAGCVLCNDNNKIEVDHYPTKFCVISKDFIQLQKNKNKPAPTEFKYHPTKGMSMFKDGTISNDHYDKKWKQAWQRYHNKHSAYRYLCSFCNKKN